MRSTLALSGLVNNRNEVSPLALTDAKRPKPTRTYKNIASEPRNLTTSEPQNCCQARFFVTAQREHASSPGDQAQLANRSSAQRATRAETGIKTLIRIGTRCHSRGPINGYLQDVSIICGANRQVADHHPPRLIDRIKDLVDQMFWCEPPILDRVDTHFIL